MNCLPPVKRIGGVATLSPVPARPTEPSLEVFFVVEHLIVHLNLEIAGAYCPTGAEPPEPGFFVLEEQLLLHNIFQVCSSSSCGWPSRCCSFCFWCAREAIPPIAGKKSDKGRAPAKTQKTFTSRQKGSGSHLGFVLRPPSHSLLSPFWSPESDLGQKPI